jgi:hypothetical protein
MKKLLIVVFSLLFCVNTAGAKMLYEYGSFYERAGLAVKNGIVNNINDYEGSYEQNIRLLSALEEKEKLGSSPFQPSGISVNIREDLVAGASRTATTLNIDSMITLDGHRLTFSDFNSTIAYAKLDQGSDNEEIISFTGITDNTTYYTLTGCNWGYDFYRNATSTANYKRHYAGSPIIITNDWHFVDTNYVSLNSAQTISGVKTFSASPIVPTPTAAQTTAAASVEYVGSVANQGAATSSESLGGISELATQTEMASSTDLGANRPLVMQAKYATSTPSTGTGNYAVITESDKKINQSFLDLTEEWAITGTSTLSKANITNLYINDTKVTSSADELNKLDGTSANVTHTNLNTLTAGTSSSATALHYHGSYDTLMRSIANRFATIVFQDTVNFTDNVTGGGVTQSAFYTKIQTTSMGDDAITTLELGRDSAGGDYPFVALAKDANLAFVAEFQKAANQDSFMGFHTTDLAAIPADATDVAVHTGFYVQDGTLYASNANGSTQTKTEITGVTLTNANGYEMVYDAGNSVKFYINGTLRATHTTNLPPTTADAVYLVFGTTLVVDNTDSNIYLYNGFVLRVDPK